MKNGKPVLAFVGYGRAGKDTACEFLRDHTDLIYMGGCSWTSAAYMAKRLSAESGIEISAEEAYANRHNDRDKWYRYLNEYREKDPSLLIKDCLEHSDIICGVRDAYELKAAKDEGLLDLIIWVDRDVPLDKTVTFSKFDADLIIENYHTIPDYHHKLERLAKTLGLWIK